MTRIIVSVALLAISNISIAHGSVEFRHDVPEGVRPWVHENVDSADDKFAFAIFSGLTGGVRPRVFEIAVAIFRSTGQTFVSRLLSVVEIE